MISEYMFEDLFSLAGAGDYDIVGCRLKEINEDELLKTISIVSLTSLQINGFGVLRISIRRLSSRFWYRP